MISDVKIYDGQGNLKEVVPGEELKEKHWEEFKRNKGSSHQTRLKKGRARFRKSIEEIFVKSDPGKL